MSYKQTYNPCDDCRHSYSKNNQEMNECKICEFKRYIDLDCNNRLLKLPVAVGSTVWETRFLSAKCSYANKKFDEAFCVGCENYKTPLRDSRRHYYAQ